MATAPESPFGFLIPPLAPLVPPDFVPQVVSANQLAYSIPATSLGSTLAVFLLPGQTLPAGSAAALYIQFPGRTDFRFLGALGDGKASAVFRVAGLKPGAAAANSNASNAGGPTFGGEVDMDADGPAASGTGGSAGSGAEGSENGNVTVGISLEPEAEVAAKVAAQKAAAAGQAGANGATASTEGALVRRGDVTEGTSAAGASIGGGNGGSGLQPSTKVLAQRIIKNAFNFLASFEGGTGMVPIKAFEGWWQKFERRIENDPTFLERDQD